MGWGEFPPAQVDLIDTLGVDANGVATGSDLSVPIGQDYATIVTITVNGTLLDSTKYAGYIAQARRAKDAPDKLCDITVTPEGAPALGQYRVAIPFAQSQLVKFGTGYFDVVGVDALPTPANKERIMEGAIEFKFGVSR